MNTLVALVQVVASVAIGWLVKYTVSARPWALSLSGVRTLFQLATCFGQALALAMLTLRSCDLVYTSGVLFVLSLANMMTAGGESMVPLDINHKYPATIMALANCFSCLSAFTISPIKSLFLGDRPGSVSRWNNLIIAIAVVNVAGGLIFWWLVKSDPIDFDGDTRVCDHESTLELRKLESAKRPTSTTSEPAPQEAKSVCGPQETEAHDAKTDVGSSAACAATNHRKPSARQETTKPNEREAEHEQPPASP